MKPEQLRARVLAEWRGLPEAAARPDRAAAVGDAVRKVMAGLGLKERLNAEEVLRAWHEVVGEFVAKHSSPFKIGRASCRERVFSSV